MALPQHKFKRNYELFIMKSNQGFHPPLVNLDPENPSNYLTFGLPFTIEFNVQRNSFTSANSANISIYNLSEQHRRLLAHDEYDFSNYQRIVLKAGYGDGPNFPTVFRGNVTKCQSYRQGVDFITVIEALDGGFALNNASFDLPFIAHTPRTTVLKTMMQSLAQYRLNIGSIGNYDTSTAPKRGESYSGDTIPLLSDLTGGGVFIDLETINCLKDGEYIYFSDIPLITAKSGLLGTPLRQQSFLEFEMLFEPRIAIGKLIELQSSTGFNYNGFFKVASVEHRGMISEAVCGELVTRVGVPYVSGFQALTPVQAI